MDLSIYMISLDTSLSGQSYLLQSTGYGDKLFFIWKVESSVFTL